MARQPLDILSGVRILSLTQFLLGPAGVQYLADMGAEVIKIEPPGAGAWERSWSGANTFLNDVSAFYLLAHRNVRSLTLNLKHSEGQEVARQLAAKSDVLVQNFRPGVIDKFGLDYETVKDVKSDIIYVSASGYGEDSPYAHLPGQDLLVQAMAGLVAATGRAGELPTPAGAAVVDQHGAALLAMGVLAALLHRERTGEGQKLEVTMLQAALDLQMEPVVYWLNGGKLERPWTGLATTFHPAPYGIYQTQDGYLALSITPIKVIREALGGPAELEMYEDPALAMDQREEIYRALNPIIRGRTTEAWLDLLRARGVWCAPVNDYEHVFADPAVQHLDPVMEVEHPRAGRVRLLKHPVQFGAGEPELRRMPPSVGEDSDDILAELGYSPEHIQRLRSDHAI